MFTYPKVHPHPSQCPPLPHHKAPQYCVSCLYTCTCAAFPILDPSSNKWGGGVSPTPLSGSISLVLSLYNTTVVPGIWQNHVHVHVHVHVHILPLHYNKCTMTSSMPPQVCAGIVLCWMQAPIPHTGHAHYMYMYIQPGSQCDSRARNATLWIVAGTERNCNPVTQRDITVINHAQYWFVIKKWG